MAWPWEVVERDHEIQDPVSPEKIRLVVHWRSTEEWLAEHPDHPDADDIRVQHESQRLFPFQARVARLGDLRGPQGLSRPLVNCAGG
jgi:hypothetical protein